MYRSKKPHLQLSLEVEEKDVGGGEHQDEHADAFPRTFGKDQSFRMSPDVFQKANIQVDASGVHIVNRTSRFAKLCAGDFIMKQSLGRGISGSVDLGVHKDSGEKYALKQIKVYNKSGRDQVLEEIVSLYDASCDCLIGFHGAFVLEGSITLALEYMDEGSLSSLVEHHGALPEHVLAAVLYQACWGLSYLHYEKRVHRDIKPQNILCNRQGHVKLTDFGISKQLQNTIGVCNTVVGTFKYMSPERIQSEQYSYTSDVWSLGLTAVECAIKKYPYPDCRTYIDMIQTILDHPVPELPASFSSEAKEFIGCCLQHNPSDRVPARILLHSPWFHKGKLGTVEEARYAIKLYLTNNTPTTKA